MFPVQCILYICKHYTVKPGEIVKEFSKSPKVVAWNFSGKLEVDGPSENVKKMIKAYEVSALDLHKNLKKK